MDQTYTTVRMDPMSPDPPASTGSHSTLLLGNTEVTVDDLVSRLASVSRAVNEIEHCVLLTSTDSRSWLKIKHDWINIAIILDRVFFISYVAIIILSISFLFPRP